MKKVIFTILIAGCSVFAQEKITKHEISINEAKGDTIYSKSISVVDQTDITPRNQMLIVNPLKFLLFYNITYYGKVSDNLVIGGGIQFPTIRDINGFGLNAELRYYPSGRNLRGFYFAPNFSFNHIYSGEGSTSPFSMGILAGWQWFPGDQFAIGLGLGVDYYFGTVNNEGDFENYKGSVPALRFDIGYAW